MVNTAWDENIRLECRDLSARYASITVVQGVSFTASAGAVLALLGVNGAGKSSLLGAIAGIVSGDGSIRVRGQELRHQQARLRAAHGLALVPERRGNIFGRLSVQENMEMGLRLLDKASRDDWQAQLLALFPILKERWRTMAGMLSGGEQQMLSIAMALGGKPSALLLDEPTQGLAPSVFDTLEQIFSTLKNTGLALVLAEQNVSFAARVADEFLVLSQGSISRRGLGSELNDADRVATYLLGDMVENSIQA